MARTSTSQSLVRLLTPVVTAGGLDLEDVTVTPAGKRSLVRVVVDKDGGVSLDDVAAVSTGVSDALDASDAMGATPYVLEVSSPGVDRPLTQARHWRRAHGRLVAATLTSGQRRVGRVVDVRDDGVVLDVDGKEHPYAWAAIARARVEVEFSVPDGSQPDGSQPDGSQPDGSQPDESQPDEGDGEA